MPEISQDEKIRKLVIKDVRKEKSDAAYRAKKLDRAESDLVGGSMVVMVQVFITSSWSDCEEKDVSVLDANLDQAIVRACAAFRRVNNRSDVQGRMTAWAKIVDPSSKIAVYSSEIPASMWNKIFERESKKQV